MATIKALKPERKPPGISIGRFGIVAALLASPLLTQAQSSGRVSEGLKALYDFRETKSNFVRDRSGVGQPVDLKITNPKAVRRTDGALEILGKTEIRSEKAASKITNAVKKSGEITIEAWIHPANTRQEGPARIVTLSRGSSDRNFTLGQEKDRFNVRLRTGRTGANGMNPSLTSPAKSLAAKPTHVVYTRAHGGRARLYLDGKPRMELAVPGEISNWDGSFQLGLGNEIGADRQWSGTFHLAAIYSRALGPDEVTRNFKAGAGALQSAPVSITEAKLPPKPAPASPPKPEPSPPKPKLVATPIVAPAVGDSLPGSRRGLIAFYDFSEADGDLVRDRSKAGEPVNLKIADPQAVRRAAGSLEVLGKTVIQSEKPASRITGAVKRAGEFSIEAWIRPASTKQEGPARIVTLSKDTGERNFTLGQDGDQFDVRFRTSRTDGNGSPSTAAPDKSLETRLTHVVYTRDKAGRGRLYLDGQKRSEREVAGDLNPWNGSFRIALANEQSKDRPWLGTFHRVAIYNRSLTPGEIAGNFKAGPKGEAGPPIPLTQPNEQLFEKKIAPLLANHCLECHDPSTKEGKLDFSKKLAAFATDGVIIPGNSKDSLIWEMVESDEMPEDRDPLSPEEKKALREWINGGANWPASVATIDPAIYVRPQRPASAWVQRLTVPEYIETVRSAVGVDIAEEARRILPPDQRADGFSNTAYNLNVDLKHIGAYADLAEIIVKRMDVPKFVRRFGGTRDVADDKGNAALLSEMGKWLLRGPLTTDEIHTYRGITTTVASAGGDFDEAMGYTVEAMLQSPRFIYRIEQQQGDGSLWPVDDYEMASRMSYLLWGGPPDKGLLDAAGKSDLGDPGKVRAQVQRMLEDPRAVNRSLQFVSEWLNLGRLENLNPDPKKFPNWNPALAADMRRETLAFFEEVVWKQKRPLGELLDAQVTFATPRLARHYGLASRESGSGPSRYDLSSVPSRGGLLTHGSVLTIGGDEASMVTRGLFVFNDLLRGTVRNPPPDLDVSPVPTKAGLTHRDVAEQRIENVNCGSCHAKFEPLAFGLEMFDGLGSFSEKDRHGNPLRSDGEILFPGEAEPVKYRNSAELMSLLAKSDRVAESLTWKVTQFALGRPLTAEDAPFVKKIHRQAQKNGGTYESLITAIVLSDLVRMKRTEES